MNHQNTAVEVMACGDINIQARAEPAEVISGCRDHLGQADVLIGNLEMCLSSPEDRIPFKTAWKQSDKNMIEALVNVGFDAVTTANNVTFGQAPIASTTEILDRVGIKHTGSGKDDATARQPAIVEHEGTRIGLLGYSCLIYPFGHRATAGSAGVAAIQCETAYQPHPRAAELPGVPPTVRSWPVPEDIARCAAEIADLKTKVDVVIVYVHMGVSSQITVAEYQYEVGRALIDAGADCVFGASAHKAQAIEVYRSKPIFYGLGNLCLDYPKLVDRRDGIIARVRFENGAVTSAGFAPVFRPAENDNRPVVQEVDSYEGRRIIELVTSASEALGTKFDVGERSSREVEILLEPAIAD